MGGLREVKSPTPQIWRKKPTWLCLPCPVPQPPAAGSFAAEPGSSCPSPRRGAVCRLAGTCAPSPLLSASGAKCRGRCRLWEIFCMPRYSLLLLLGLLKATLSPLAAASEDKGVLDPLQGSAGSSALPRLSPVVAPRLCPARCHPSRTASARHFYGLRHLFVPNAW